MTEPTQTPPPAPASSTPSGSGRWIKLALALSLAVNLGIAGLAAGAALKFRDGGGHQGNPRDIAFGPYTEALTRDQRRAMLRDLADGGGGLRDIRKGLQADLDAVLQSLKAQPFDPEAFRSALDLQGENLSRRLGDGRRALADVVIAMSESERAEFTDTLERRLGERRRRD